MGVPVVSTDVGGQTELIDDTVGGIVHCNINANSEVYSKEIDCYVKEIGRVLDNLKDIKKNCRQKIEKGFTLDLMVNKFENIIEEGIKKESNTKPIDNGYIDYNFAVETMNDTYYFYCKNYIESKFNINYEGKNKIKKKSSWSKKRMKYIILLNRCYAKEDAKVILDFLRAIKRMLKELFISLKLFLKSIPAGIKLIYKLIRGNQYK